ncbi:MAG: aspartate carbamoyltransferase [Xanthomonadales bacterium]|nr:aspartate carbamoyltransferase [Gammaproteobacteria bacterium]MBT8053509.1 aspartate carbamoyltransferase [Gammaproteobacteria bacterium]NNK50824.1 aspartate carbamoyltransferase [Xanthomonadales bacterium]
MRHVISVHDFSVEQIVEVLDRAEDMVEIARGQAVSDLLRGKLLACIFFEPSTRTRLSFETAMNRLGGGVIGFAGTQATSVVKGETLADTIRMVSGYADAVVLRHPREGAAKLATEFSSVPVVNAGDGAGQHPTQTLLDLFTIRTEKGRLEGLNISLVGDLRFGRTVHSLAIALSKFGNTINLVSPEGLEMPGEVTAYLKSTGMLGAACHSPDEVMADTDILYATRIQKERFPDPVEYEKVAGMYRVDPDLLEKGPEDMIVMHPLPRVNEISPEVDSLPQAKYFVQAFNGVPVRMALLSMVMGG